MGAMPAEAAFGGLRRRWQGGTELCLLTLIFSKKKKMAVHVYPWYPCPMLLFKVHDQSADAAGFPTKK
jgi:hypothetical protein